MLRNAVEKARELHRRHPGLTFPLDMDCLAAAEGCQCLDWPFLEPVREVKSGRWIGLADWLDPCERRRHIAHALGHHLLHCGNQLVFRDSQKVLVSKQEREAEACAAHIMMPQDELEKVRWMTECDIADHFGVPEDMVHQRLTVFATETEMTRWHATGEEETGAERKK